MKKKKSNLEEAEEEGFYSILLHAGSVIAQLFAMILDHRIAVWAEDEGIKAKGTCVASRFQKRSPHNR